MGSSSKNTPLILQRLGLEDLFDAVADGNDITRSKPDPEVFLLAAEDCGCRRGNVWLWRMADAGLEAALAGGFIPAGHRPGQRQCESGIPSGTVRQLIELCGHAPVE